MAHLLTHDEALDVIRSGKIGHLGFVADGELFVMPINYIFEDGSIYSHSLPGLKIDAMRSHGRVCFQVEEIESNLNWRSVLIHGNFEELRVPSDRRKVLTKLIARFPLLTPVESLMAQDASAPDSIVFRIIVDRMTCVGEENPKVYER
jgi:nitroimidazol reductase NimA-like FMN-containing flavoprotein (pyridoxamine 5'-phosphate oxidase superfamily)